MVQWFDVVDASKGTIADLRFKVKDNFQTEQLSGFRVCFWPKAPQQGV